MNTTPDPFSLLEIPCRPLLDEKLLEKNFRHLAAIHHPDQSRGTSSRFEELEAARQLLKQPATRLRYLAGATTGTKVLPKTAEELFSTVATALRNAEETSKNYQHASGTLAKALCMKNLMTSNAHLKMAATAVKKWRTQLESELESLEVRWPDVSPEELLQLASSFTFLTRWETQLAEELFLFSTLLPIT